VALLAAAPVRAEDDGVNLRDSRPSAALIPVADEDTTSDGTNKTLVRLIGGLGGGFLGAYYGTALGATVGFTFGMASVMVRPPSTMTEANVPLFSGAVGALVGFVAGTVTGAVLGVYAANAILENKERKKTARVLNAGFAFGLGTEGRWGLGLQGRF
jgi:hypothetical protein